jgi:NAD(P)-dependent dehydrogenase (short-subunit alcohol dehydrogenase family)
MAETSSKALVGKVALVTGGASGIGAASARLLARNGATVVVADLNAASALEVARACEALGVSAIPLAMEVTDENSVEGGIDNVVSQFGRVDILVNSAGISLRHPAMEMPIEVWDKVLAVNVKGTFLPSRVAARHMKSSGGGTIVNVASIMAFSGFGLGGFPNPAYQASKGAVLNLTRALAVEWAPLKIRVNAVAPTYVRTPLINALLAKPDTVELIKQVTPLGRVAEPEEVAEAILFLAGPQSSMTTGHTLAVDGGFLAQ